MNRTNIPTTTRPKAKLLNRGYTPTDDRSPQESTGTAYEGVLQRSTPIKYSKRKAKPKKYILKSLKKYSIKVLAAAAALAAVLTILEIGFGVTSAWINQKRDVTEIKTRVDVLDNEVNANTERLIKIDNNLNITRQELKDIEQPPRARK